MNSEDKLKSKVGTETGFRVPDNYFDEIYSKISAQLPESAPEETPAITRWQRIRPYIYLAAMFAGIWCTMKMVDMMSGADNEVSLNNPPALVAQAMQSPDVTNEMALQSSVDNIEIATDLAEEYPDFESFANEFDYDFEDEYADIDISELQKELASSSDDDSYINVSDYDYI